VGSGAGFVLAGEASERLIQPLVRSTASGGLNEETAGWFRPGHDVQFNPRLAGRFLRPSRRCSPCRP